MIGKAQASIQIAGQKLGLSQTQFALALGIKIDRLRKWERGAARLTMTEAEMRHFQQLSEEVFNAWVRGDVARLRSGRAPHDDLEQDLPAFRLCA